MDKLTLDSGDIARMRRELNMSQASLGALFGSDGRTVRRWESGKMPVPRYAQIIIRAIHSGKLKIGVDV